MALSGARNQHYRTLSYSVASGILGTHNPLVPGSNPGGPTNIFGSDPDTWVKRTATFPEIAIEPSFQDYVAGADAALQYALTAPKPENIQEVLEGALLKGPDELGIMEQESYGGISCPLAKSEANCGLSGA